MRTVFITGATGAIGSVLAKYLLEENGTHLRLLVRAESRAHSEQRLRALFEFWELDPADQSLSSRVEAVIGDVTRPQLGIDSSTYQRLATEVTHVVHSAGNVKLNRSIDDARQSAVDSARHVVAFVDACRQAGTFKKLDLVSTVGVAGRMRGTVPERPLRESRVFRNSYEAAKAEAETFVLDQMQQGLPVTIHRPSMVVGDSHSGRVIQFQVFYYLCEFLSGRRTAGIVPDAGRVRLDIIPVDYVARAIQSASQRDETSGRIFHLCSGPIEAPLINELSDRVRQIFFEQRRHVPPCRRVPAGLLRMLLPVASRIAPHSARRALQSLPFFLAYLDGSEQTFGNSESAQFFSATGLNVPRVDSYLGAVLSYYLAHNRDTTPANGKWRGAA